VKDYNGTNHPYPPPERTRSSIRSTEAIADPYRWMENTGTPASVRGSTPERAHPDRARRHPGKERVRKALPTCSRSHDRRAEVAGIPLFLREAEGDENQPVLYGARARSRAEVLLDPNALSAEGIVAVDWWFRRIDGRFVAYGLSRAGARKARCT